MTGYTFNNGLTASFGKPQSQTAGPAAAPATPADTGMIGGQGGDVVSDTTTRTFAQDVIEASRQVPVLVDFWAPWCGPCKQLTPVLEKVVRAYRGKVKLVKMNIDEHPEVAGKLGIQSIPAVVAFVKGRPADAFMGAVPEAQVKSFIDRLAAGGNEIDQMLTAANDALAAGDVETAASAFTAVLEEDRENVAAIGGLARVFISIGDLDKAKQILTMVPPGKEADPSVAAAVAQLELAERAADLGEIPELEARIAADANDHAARFDLAVALNARGDAKGAVNHLIEIVRRERAWNEDAARKQLVQFFEAWGPADPNTAYGRRRLSSVLFA